MRADILSFVLSSEKRKRIVKAILKNRASDRELSKLIDAQADVHERFNYSFAFNFEYIQEDQFTKTDNDYKIF